MLFCIDMNYLIYSCFLYVILGELQNRRRWQCRYFVRKQRSQRSSQRKCQSSKSKTRGTKEATATTAVEQHPPAEVTRKAEATTAAAATSIVESVIDR